MTIKRKLDIVVISDVHLGTDKCHAKKLLNYLNSIDVKHIILNGNFIGLKGSFEKKLPKTHLKILKKLMTFSANGTLVTCVVGKNTAKIGKIDGRIFGNISFASKLTLEFDGKKALFFHGSDLNVLKNKWQRIVGQFRAFFKVKPKNTKAFTIENTALTYAIENSYDYVATGCTYSPKIETKQNAKGTTTYLNSGDWTQNFTALEYRLKRWKLYRYNSDKLIPFIVNEVEDFNEEVLAKTS